MITDIMDYTSHQEGIKGKAAKLDQLTAQHQAEVNKLAQVGSHVIAADQQAQEQAAKTKMLNQAYQVGEGHGAEGMYAQLMNVLQEVNGQGYASASDSGLARYNNNNTYKG